MAHHSEQLQQVKNISVNTISHLAFSVPSSCAILWDLALGNTGALGNIREAHVTSSEGTGSRSASIQDARVRWPNSDAFERTDGPTVLPLKEQQ